MKLDLYNLTNEKVGEVEVSDDVFATDVRPHLFHEVVKMQLANRRRGTHKGKTRSEVSGGGKKPFKQKGTGNARQGTSRAPHMVGGGRAFARRNRDYSYALNKKKCRAALCSALSMAAGEGQIKVVDCQDSEREHTTLNNENLRLSVRNLQSYKYLRPEGVNVYDILHYGGLVVTRKGLEKLEARLLG